MNVYIWRRDDYSAMRGPCPEGFHIPSKEWWEGVIQILTSTFGMEINGTTLGTYLKMPMAGSRSRFTSEVSGVGTSGDYWSCTPGSSSPLFGVEFWFEAETSAILPMREFGRAFGYSLRWFKDSPVVPTSSWTTLYDWGNGAWIFRSSAEWLISISGNWLTRCTMQDKNLWATTVYNQWNTLTDANCGYFYQWGNNYGFSHSWTVTTSSTQVDASWYWPGNYYSSSTFIMNNNSWSSVQNDDLRWYVTWIQAVGHPIKNAYIGEPNPFDDYQEVEYIQNSGTQWIDTWFYPDSNTMVQMKYIYTNYNWGSIFWAWWTAWESDQFRYFRASNYTYLDYGSWNNYNRIYWTYVTSTTAIYETEFWNRYVKDIPTNTVKFSWGTVSFSRKSYTAKIFPENWSDLMKLYYCKVYDNWTLVRDFIPCYRKSDNVIWLYDMVNDQFYTNSGSGSFTKWPDVN